MLTRNRWVVMMAMAVVALATTGFVSLGQETEKAGSAVQGQQRAQQPPSGPEEKVQAPSKEAEVEKQEVAAAAPAEARAAGYVYAGGRQGGWHIFGQRSRGIFRDRSNPPRYYANSMTFAGTLANAWWVFNLDGFPGPPQFAFEINAAQDHYRIFYRINPNSAWGNSPFDTTGRGVALGNGQ